MSTALERKRVGWIGTCPTPYCGRVEGYFCVRCRHYTSYCACGYNYGGCSCEDRNFWASTGERRELEERLRRQNGD